MHKQTCLINTARATLTKIIQNHIIMSTIDTLIEPHWIITVNDDDQVLENHSLAVQNGLIIDILPSDEAKAKYQPNKTLKLDGHALLPGFINSHTHAAMNLFRGLADDRPLMEWLQEHIWPAEQQHTNQEFVKTGTQLAVAEMLRSGTTCFNDMYFFPDETAKVATETGIRACVGLIVIDFPTVWANDADEYIHKGLQLHDQLRHQSLITTAFAPHAPYTVSDTPLQKILTLSEELDIPVHMHIHETIGEINTAVEATGKRPLQRLHDLEALSPKLLGVHMTQLEQDEIDCLATEACHVIHCPESNQKLASGLCPVQRLIDAGVNVALGTDGAASNNDLDMLGEMRSAALLGKIASMDAQAVNATTALRMATINGAKALGLDDITGSLEVGKAADMTAIQLDSIETQPLYDPVSQLVYAAGREQVTHVWVAGKLKLNNRELTCFDEENLLADVAKWQQQINIT